MPKPDDADIRITPAIRDYLAAFDAWLRNPNPYHTEAKRLALHNLETDTKPLTAREAQVLALRARGRSRRRIAETLGITPKTVDHHMEHIHAKAGTSDPYLLAIWTIHHGYLT